MGFTISPFDFSASSVVHFVRTSPPDRRAPTHAHLETIMSALGCTRALPPSSVGIRFSFFKDFAAQHSNLIHEHMTCQEVWETFLVAEGQPLLSFAQYGVPSADLAPSTTVVCLSW